MVTLYGQHQYTNNNNVNNIGELADFMQENLMIFI